jgi:transcriptional regulator with XRE-family HTH domain
MSPRRLSTVIKEQRHKQHLTQAELAQKVGVNQSYIALLEKGDKENPSLVVLKRIAKALNVPVTTLLE